MCRYGMAEQEESFPINELTNRQRAEWFYFTDLEVIELAGWRREMWWDQSGRPWVAPSPNMPTLATATVYPGTCLVEGTNLSESVTKNLAFLKKMQGKAELRAAAKEREGSDARLSELRETAKDRISKYPNPKKALAGLLGGRGMVSLSFRKVGAMNEKDVIDALGDAELLGLLERLEGSEE